MDIQKTTHPITAPASLEKLDPKGNPLSPTPTSDLKDPLNWSLLRKSTCLFIVVYSYFMLTYFTTAPIPSFGFLEEQLNINYSQVSWSFALPCLGLAVGPLLVGALADTYGRRPVLIACTALAVLASGCTSIKTINFEGYMAARFFQGLGAGPSANIGLVIIHDISFEHERGLRVGMWTIAANAGTVLGDLQHLHPRPRRLHQRLPRTQGLLLIGLLVGLLFAEVVCSGNLSDKLMSHLTRKNGGTRVPEMRLWLGYPAAVVSSVGLVLWGVSVDRDWHWMVGQVAFFLYTLGLQTGNTVLSAYIVDNYPEHANEVITFYTVIINLSAFINPWFIYYWVESSGYAWTFATQCIICSFGLIPLYILLQVYGVRLRSTRPMYTKHINDMLELPTAQVASGGRDIPVKQDRGDAV
ncbi:MFS transporter, putative [Talaromyces marneffei ATCC 18224]|uniref:MFS transporter, putative n=1 Tax=Talaromyces marneffei (strain ATCC 18224 / CBS 334.59 / QM 7333) TaxID=441960 RepID=B6QIM4_TALMQ|nr:MFS transporter, putative [Talaromyces marneffei ATCC 18224]